MKKILLVSMGEEFGGIEKLELDYLKNLNSKYKIDFLTPNDNPFKKFKKVIKQNGGKIYNFNVSRKKYIGRIKYFFNLFIFLKKNKYDIVHINSSVFLFSFQVVLVTKLCGVKKIIVHSHSTPKNNIFKKIIIYLLNPVYRFMINHYISCSKKACYSLFTKRFVSKNKILILKNGIDVEMFKYNKSIRKKIRDNLDIDNKVVYGNVGRLSYEKNHDFLIDIFYEIQKTNKDSVLLLIGDGILKEKINDKVKRLKLDKKVIFLDFKDDVYNYYNCMDLYIVPSLSEGFGITSIEAQTNGLITYCSMEVPEEVNISSNIRFFNLDIKAKELADSILKEKKLLNGREKAFINTINSQYDIKNICNVLDSIYSSNN